MDPSMLLAADVGSQGLSNIMNFASTQFTNAQQRQFSREMYDRQRRDALEFWGMQNDYNSPKNVVARLQDAGLNRAFAYGGNGGSASPVQLPDISPVNFREPRFEAVRFDPLQFADLRIKNAQANNLETQTNVIREQGNIAKWRALHEELNYNLENNLFDVNADARREGLRKTRTEIDIMIDRNAREAALNASNVAEAAERMATLVEQRKGMPLERGRVAADTERIRQQIELMKQDGTLKDMDIALREKGINPSDPLWTRYVGMFLSDIYEGRVTAGDIGTSFWKWLLGK